eukprot:scaffold17829_cov30-Tisochrysis_lutea.AAC.3
MSILAKVGRHAVMWCEPPLASFIDGLKQHRGRGVTGAGQALALMPARRKSRSTSGTPSCNLSSMAVAPCSVRFASSWACKSSMALGSPTLRFKASEGDSMTTMYSDAHAA